MNILLLIGTTRKQRSTPRAAKLIENKIKERENLSCDVADLKTLEIPFFKERHTESGHPNKDVERLGKKINDSDCLVIFSPEYNHSFPGSLKNALDHYYREYEDKLLAYVTTSAGGFGGIRQLSHLHDFTIAVSAKPGPNLPISKIREQISQTGKPKNDEISQKADSFLEKIQADK